MMQHWRENICFSLGSMGKGNTKNYIVCLGGKKKLNKKPQKVICVVVSSQNKAELVHGLRRKEVVSMGGFRRFLLGLFSWLKQQHQITNKFLNRYLMAEHLKSKKQSLKCWCCIQDPCAHISECSAGSLSLLGTGWQQYTGQQSA